MEVINDKENKKIRYAYIDVLRFLGILAIYLGHISSPSGPVNKFVFLYHVPLFFFVSGCMDINREMVLKEQGENPYSYKQYIKNIAHDIKALVFPWIFFSIFSLIVNILNNGFDKENVILNLEIIMKGCIRNQFFAGSLWFFTCLFIVKIIFGLIKLLKNELLIFVICILLFYISEYGLPHRPLVNPQWYWNIDSAMYYIIYYGIGFCLFPKINSLLVENDKSEGRKIKKAMSCTIFVCVGVYSALAFLGKDLLRTWQNLYLLGNLVIVMRSLLIICFNVGLAHMLQSVEFYKDIGRKTLYMCGNEYIVKICLSSITGLFGLSINGGNYIAEILYVLILLYMVNRFLVPVESLLIGTKKNLKHR